MAYIRAGVVETPELGDLNDIRYELDRYNTWSARDVWYYEIEERVPCPCEGKHPGCAGFDWLVTNMLDGETEIYGKELAMSLAQEGLDAAYAREAVNR